MPRIHPSAVSSELPLNQLVKRLCWAIVKGNIDAIRTAVLALYDDVSLTQDSRLCSADNIVDLALWFCFVLSKSHPIYHAVFSASQQAGNHVHASSASQGGSNVYAISVPSDARESTMSSQAVMSDNRLARVLFFSALKLVLIEEVGNLSLLLNKLHYKPIKDMYHFMLHACVFSACMYFLLYASFKTSALDTLFSRQNSTESDGILELAVALTYSLIISTLSLLSCYYGCNYKSRAPINLYGRADILLGALQLIDTQTTARSGSTDALLPTEVASALTVLDNELASATDVTCLLSAAHRAHQQAFCDAIAAWAFTPSLDDSASTETVLAGSAASSAGVGSGLFSRGSSDSAAESRHQILMRVVLGRPTEPGDEDDWRSLAQP